MPGFFASVTVPRAMHRLLSLSFLFCTVTDPSWQLLDGETRCALSDGAALSRSPNCVRVIYCMLARADEDAMSIVSATTRGHGTFVSQETVAEISTMLYHSAHVSE